MKYIILIILIHCVLIFANKETKKYYSEIGYFEGQKDAINEDVRIRWNDIGYYEWVKSPWNCGKNQSFEPKKSESGTIKK